MGCYISKIWIDDFLRDVDIYWNSIFWDCLQLA